MLAYFVVKLFHALMWDKWGRELIGNITKYDIGGQKRRFVELDIFWMVSYFARLKLRYFFVIDFVNSVNICTANLDWNGILHFNGCTQVKIAIMYENTLKHKDFSVMFECHAKYGASMVLIQKRVYPFWRKLVWKARQNLIHIS